MAYVIQAKTDEVQKALEKTSLSMQQINKKILTVIGRKTSNVVKSGIRQTYSPPNKYYRRTGEFLNAWTFHAKDVKKNASEVNIYPKVLYQGEAARKNRQWAMGLSVILSYGTKDGRIKPRSFVQKGEQYASSGSYMPEIQSIVDKELEKFWGK